MAGTEPCGPVYLTLPREVLVEKIQSVKVLDTDRFTPVTTPDADSSLLEKAADLLAGARNALIITGYSGRNPLAVQPLVELAETIGARVSASGSRMNFPTNHPLTIGGFTMEYLKQADVVLVIDHDIPYIPAMVKPGPGAKIIHIDIDPIKKDMVMWGFPSDILLHADSAKAIPELLALVRTKISGEQRGRAKTLLAEAQKERAKFEEESRSLALSKADQTPVSTEWFCHCLNEVIDADTLVVDESMSGGGAFSRYVPRTKPGTHFTSGGSSLGFGLGASLGVKLAAPKRDVVCLVGDGCFIFGCPTPTFWASSVYHLPFLCVIFNNEGYNAVRSNLRATFGKENFGEKEAFFAGLDIAPSPNYAMIAQACNCYGETVRTSAEAKPAIKRAMEQVRAGKAAVLDVRIAKR
jgi:acetolactate synthase-1/2/3 large subunit